MVVKEVAIGSVEIFEEAEGKLSIGGYTIKHDV